MGKDVGRRRGERGNFKKDKIGRRESENSKEIGQKDKRKSKG